jgi:hypothetical protein
MVRRSCGGENMSEKPNDQKEITSGTSVEERRLVLEAVRASVKLRAADGPGSARSQDFLYGDDGLPQ